jgi:mannitol/fructose-specific phosphotransferase system IIA component
MKCSGAVSHVVREKKAQIFRTLISVCIIKNSSVYSTQDTVHFLVLLLTQNKNLFSSGALATVRSAC